MNITVHPKAEQWYEEEVGLAPGAGIRLTMKIYGNSPLMDNYGLMLQPTEPNNPGASYETKSGLLIFVEQDDLWFFDGHDLYIDFDEELKEPKYDYVPHT